MARTFRRVIRRYSRNTFLHARAVASAAPWRPEPVPRTPRTRGAERRDNAARLRGGPDRRCEFRSGRTCDRAPCGSLAIGPRAPLGAPLRIFAAPEAPRGARRCRLPPTAGRFPRPIIVSDWCPFRLPPGSPLSGRTRGTAPGSSERKTPADAPVSRDDAKDTRLLEHYKNKMALSSHCPQTSACERPAFVRCQPRQRRAAPRSSFLTSACCVTRITSVRPPSRYDRRATQ
jgi:hypothetical protein